MTREEAIYCMKAYLLERYGASEDCPKCKYYDDCKSDEAHKMAIKALEQEPCEDCISRKALLDAIWQKEYGKDYDGVNTLDIRHINIIEKMPSVKPTRAKGKWIENEDFYGDYYYSCSVCNEDFVTMDGTKPKDNLFYFCPNCGADMRGEVAYDKDKDR